MPIETGRLEVGDRIQVKYVSAEVGAEGNRIKKSWVGATVKAVYLDGKNFKIADAVDDEGNQRDIQFRGEWRWPLN